MDGFIFATLLANLSFFGYIFILCVTDREGPSKEILKTMMFCGVAIALQVGSILQLIFGA